MRRAIGMMAAFAVLVAVWAVLAPPLVPTSLPVKPTAANTSPVPANRPVNEPIVPSPPGNGAPSRPPSVLTPMQEALRGGNPDAVRAAAAELRRRARTDPAALAELGRVLLDANADPQVRITAAVVLGTLPDAAAREALCRALRAPGMPEEVLAFAIYALAAVKQWDGDDVFHGMDNADLVTTAGGLQLTASEAVADAGARELLRQNFNFPQADAVMEALVRTLAHSLAYDEVRAMFESRIGGEADHGVQADMAVGLAGWVVQAPAAHEEERERIGRELFGLAEHPDNAGLRLALQPYMTQLPWPAGQGDRLMAVASGGVDFDQRYWAIGLLGTQPERLPAERRTEAGGMLQAILRGDGSDKLREKAALALGAYEKDVDAGAVLIEAVRRDAAWNVRLVAVRALGNLTAPPPAAAATIADAELHDPDERVREAARAARERIAAHK